MRRPKWQRPTKESLDDEPERLAATWEEVLESQRLSLANCEKRLADAKAKIATTERIIAARDEREAAEKGEATSA